MNPNNFKNRTAVIAYPVKWQEALRDRYFLFELSVSLILQAAALIMLANFLKIIEQREGITLSDPLLQILRPADLTWAIFGLIYLSLSAAIASFVKNPSQIALALQAYTVLIFIRMIAMYITPFSAPEGMIPLNDPLVEFFGTGILLTKDLFFSGHTALLFLLFLIEKRAYLKFLFLTAAVIVGIFLLIQHVHYSIDVFAAPFFSYAVYSLILKIRTFFCRFKNTANR